MLEAFFVVFAVINPRNRLCLCCLHPIVILGDLRQLDRLYLCPRYRQRVNSFVKVGQFFPLSDRLAFNFDDLSVQTLL